MRPSDFKFNEHILNIIKETNKLLGFLKRTTYEFTDIYSITNLYYSLVLSKLEFGCTIWDPSQQNLIHSLETVQNKFIKYLYYKKYHVSPDFGPYEPFRKEFQIMKLEHRRVIGNLVTLHKLLNAYIDTPYLLNQISFSIPVAGIRPRQLTLSVNNNGPLGKMCLLYNQYFKNMTYNIFNTNSRRFKIELKEIFASPK